MGYSPTPRSMLEVSILHWNVDLHLSSRRMIKTVIGHLLIFMHVAILHLGAKSETISNAASAIVAHFSAAMPIAAGLQNLDVPRAMIRRERVAFILVNGNSWHDDG